MFPKSCPLQMFSTMLWHPPVTFMSGPCLSIHTTNSAFLSNSSLLYYRYSDRCSLHIVFENKKVRNEGLKKEVSTEISLLICIAPFIQEMQPKEPDNKDITYYFPSIKHCSSHAFQLFYFLMVLVQKRHDCACVFVMVFTFSLIFLSLLNSFFWLTVGGTSLCRGRCNVNLLT